MNTTSERLTIVSCVPYVIYIKLRHNYILFMEVILLMYRNIFYSKHISWSLIKDEVFVFDEIIDKIYIFKGLYKEIWLLLNEINSFKDITSKLEEKYVGDQSVMVNDITNILDKFTKNNLLTRG